MTTQTTETTRTMPSRSTSERRGALVALWAGLVLTIAVTAFAFIDNATARVLADHIGATYPAYAPVEIDAAVSAYLVILAVIGGLGVVGWLSTIGVARISRRAAGALASVLLVIAVVLALAGLTISDTSGEVGLAPLLAWLQLLPCVAGLAAVVLFWRKSRTGS